MSLSPVETIERQLLTYNAHDLEGYMALFHEDVVIYDHPGELTLIGADAVRGRYAAIFAEKPLNRAELKHRIVLGNRVIDHEVVFRDGPTQEGFEMVAIYEVEDSLIKRIDFVRALR